MASVPWAKKTMSIVLPNRRRRRRYKTGTLAWIWLIGSIIVPLFITSFLVVNEIRLNRQAAYQNIDRSLNQATSTYHDRKNQLIAVADSLTRAGDFSSDVRTRDLRGLNSILASVQGWDKSFFAAFWDTRKQVLAQSGGIETIPPGQARMEAALERALAEQSSVALELDSTGQPRQIFIQPVYDDTTGELLGALGVGFFLEDGFVNQIPTVHAGQQIIVLADDQIVFAQLDDEEGMPLVGQPSSGELAQVSHRTKATDFLNLNTLQGTFDFKFVPMSSPADPLVVMLGIGVPTLTPLQSLVQLPNPILFVYFALVVGLGVVGFIYLKDLEGGLGELRVALHRLAEGDWRTRIVLDRPDDIGDVAGELDRVRGKSLIEFENQQSQEKEYLRILNAMGIATLQTNERQDIVWMNPAAEIFLKQTKQELEDKPWQSLFHATEFSAGTPVMLGESGRSKDGADRYLGLQVIAHSRILAKTGQKVLVMSSPIAFDNGYTGYVHILLDQTREDELRRSRDEFMMYAAHELRTPVGKLITGLDLLDEAFRERDPERQRSLMANMQRTLIQFQFFVESVLDSGSMQSGHFFLRSSRTDFKKILNTALDQLQPFLYAKWQQVELAIDLPSPCPVVADSSRIKLVLFNLLTNAIKYGGETNPVQVKSFVRDGFVITEVTDHGPGIAAEEQARIFDRFYRGKRVEMEGLGIGLGLALARTIIELHGGVIAVESAPNEGSTFWFSIPLTT